MGSFLITVKHLKGYMLRTTLIISQNEKLSKKN